MKPWVSLGRRRREALDTGIKRSVGDEVETDVGEGEGGVTGADVLMTEDTATAMMMGIRDGVGGLPQSRLSERCQGIIRTYLLVVKR